MSKKTITGEDGKTYTVKEKKAWYKKWWVWIIAIIIILIIGASMGGSSSDDSSSSSKEATTKQTKDADDSGTANTKEIPIDNQTAKVINQTSYNPNFTDSSWAGTSVKIDKVTVSKIKPLTDHDEDDNVYKGVVKVHYVVKPTRDISFYATQGTLNTNDGQQIDANEYTSDDFDGDINKGAEKSGNVVYTLKSLDKVSDIKSLRLKWDASYDTDDIDDNNSNKTYDITVNLHN